MPLYRFAGFGVKYLPQLGKGVGKVLLGMCFE